MKDVTLTRLMYGLIVVGISLIATGVGIAIFTDVATSGVKGVSLIAGLIAGGLFLSIPAKIYLTLQLMKYNDARVRAQRAAEAKSTQH